MALFEGLKKEIKETRQNEKKKVVIYGQDWSSLEIYSLMVEKFGNDEVLLVDENDFHSDYRFFPGPSLNRGAGNEAVLKHFVKDLQVKPIADPVFYKDQKFRSFKGKARPLKIFEDESYFQTNGFSIENSIQVKEIENLNFKKLNLSKIELINDENYKFKLSFDEGIDIESEYLFFGYSLNQFIKLSDKKAPEINSLLKSSENIYDRPCLVVEFSHPLGAMSDGTYFIPQNQTIERGHFVVEALSNDEAQTIKCFCGVDREEFNEEELSRKIKLLKRSLERVFEDFHSMKSSEKIWCFSSSPVLNIENEIQSLPENLFFFGRTALVNFNEDELSDLEVSISDIHSDARSFLALSCIEKNFV